MKDNTKYPERIYANFHSHAGEHIYGCYSNMELYGKNKDNEIYIRADLVLQKLDEAEQVINDAKQGLNQANDSLQKAYEAIPQWQPFPTDRNGFGLYDEVFAMEDSITIYRDGTMFDHYEYDEELAGDIERHPDRFMWMRVGKPFEDE